MSVKFPRTDKRNFTRNLVKRHKLASHLDRYLSTEVEDFQFAFEPKLEDDAWHPSGHCTLSVTALYGLAKSVIDGTAEKKQWDVAMLKTFMVGHFWHQLLQKAVVDLGFATPDAIERKGTRGWKNINQSKGDSPEIWAPYHYATGSGDIAPCSIPKHGDYVVDFKTMSSHQFKTNGIPDWAADKYEAQINIYMDFFNLDKGIILAINKDTPHDFKEFEFVRNQPLIDAIYDKWQFVSECLDNDEAPTTMDYELFNNLPFTGPIAQ